MILTPRHLAPTCTTASKIPTSRSTGQLPGSLPQHTLLGHSTRHKRDMLQRCINLHTHSTIGIYSCVDVHRHARNPIYPGNAKYRTLLWSSPLRPAEAYRSDNDALSACNVIQVCVLQHTQGNSPRATAAAAGQRGKAAAPAAVAAAAAPPQ